MIEKVQKGQRLTAETQNQIIERANGLQTPSGSFVNTPEGTLTPCPGYESRYGYFPVPSTVLQAKRGPAVRMTRRGTKTDYDRYDVTEEVMTWHVLLGPDVDTLLRVLPSKNPPSAIWLGGATRDLTIEVTDVFLQSLRRAECYADLAAYGETALAVKEVKLSDSQNPQGQGMTILVICGVSFDDFSKMLDAYGSYDTATEVNSVLFAKIDGDQDPFQLPLKAPGSAVSSVYTGDSQVPVLHLSSVAVKNIAGTDYIQLHEFQADNTKQASALSSARVDILVRNRSAPGGRELQYVALSSISGGGGGRYTPPDADVPDAGTSSIQTYESEGGSVEEFFNFHDLSTVSVYCDTLSGYDFVMRDP